MSSLYLTEIVGHVAEIDTVVTIITNSILIYLTLYRVKNITGIYKVLLIAQAEIGVVFSLFELLARPFMHSYNASFIFFTSSRVYGATKWFRTLLAVAYATIYHIIISCMAIQFICRHLLISGSPRKLRWFKGRGILYWIGYIAGFSIAWILVIISCLPDTDSMSYMKKELEENYGTPIENFAGFLILVYDPHTNYETWRINSLVCIFGLSTVLCCHYAVIVFCSLEIHSKMKGLTSMTSLKTHRLQSQLFLTLILQIVAPSIFHHIPALVMYYATFLNLTVSFPSGIMIALFSIYPSVDSCILMSVVSEYKKVIRQLIHQFLVRQARAFQASSSPKSSAEDPARVEIEMKSISS